MIKYWDYVEDYKSKKRKILSELDRTLKSGSLLFGPQLKKLEKNICSYHKSKYGIGVANGTDAILIALKSFGIGTGDEIITVANTAIPTISAIEMAGAKPVFVDVRDDYLIDPNKIEKKISKKTKAIIPVHLFGQVCQMDKIMKIAKKNNLKIIEDCAQSFGAEYKSKKCGTFGDAGCFSFYPTKILGSFGDAGFVLYKNKKNFLKGKRIRFYGIETESKLKFNKKYYSLESGINSRLSEIQATILNIKLKNIDKEISLRRKISQEYFKGLKNTSCVLPVINPGNKHSFHIFPILSKRRDSLKNFLIKSGIETSINYPYPVHKMPTFKKYICKKCNCLKKTEHFSKKLLSLPMYPALTIKKIKKIISVIKTFR